MCCLSLVTGKNQSLKSNEICCPLKEMFNIHIWRDQIYFQFWNTTIQLYPSALLLRISCWDSTGQLTCQPSVIVVAIHEQVNISSKALRETFDSMISETWVMKCVIRRNSWCESSSDGLPTLTLASQHNIPLPSVWSLASVCFDHCLFTMEELELPRKLVYRSENQYLGRNLQTSPIMHSWLDRYVQSCGKLALCRSTNSNLLMVESKSVRINLYC